MAAIVNIRGPPWYDEYSGEELPDSEVRTAMAKEMQSFNDMKAKRTAEEAELKEPAAEVIDMCWHLHRCRLCPRKVTVVLALN